MNPRARSQASATHTRSILPLELLNHIFSYMHCFNDRKATLFACSLVSHTWRETTLRHRFHSLAFHIRSGFWSDDDVLVYPPVNQLLRFVKTDVYPGVRSYVRSLRLWWRRGTPIDPRFAPLINHFPSLQILELKGLIASPVAAARRYEPIVPHIRVLALHGHIWNDSDWNLKHSYASLCELLRQFASLDELRLEDVDYYLRFSRDERVNLSDVPLPATNVLVLKGTHQAKHTEDLMSDILKQLTARQRLERLDLVNYSYELEDVKNILSCLGITPEHIRLDLAPLGNTPCRPEDADATYTRGEPVRLPQDLQRLTLMIRLIKPPEAENDTSDEDSDSEGDDMFDEYRLEEDPTEINCLPWEDASTALATLTSLENPDCRSLLEHITINIVLKEPEEDFLSAMKTTLYDLRDYVGRLERVLLRLHAEGQLQDVTVSLYKDVFAESGLDPHRLCPAAEYLRSVFPDLEEEGILRVY